MTIRSTKWPCARQFSRVSRTSGIRWPRTHSVDGWAGKATMVSCHSCTVFNRISDCIFVLSGYHHEDQRLYFRRLSQTTQTDVLLGNLDNSDTSRVFLRPMTVQQRIKELNLRARMFADTMMAIQTPSNKHSLHGPRSLQVSVSLPCLKLYLFLYLTANSFCRFKFFCSVDIMSIT